MVFLARKQWQQKQSSIMWTYESQDGERGEDEGNGLT